MRLIFSKLTIVFLFMVFLASCDIDSNNLDNRRVKLVSRCTVSLGAEFVHVNVKGKDLMVELPQGYKRKYPGGKNAWISLIGICHMQPQGGPDTQEHADGYVDVETILFYDQNDNHQEFLKIIR
ncbi:MAG: hypothetical protein K8S27_11595 [Candidatus Omnitrophica bacterium]|nr:hypothetical protein [Candidatus Omnitrophota bacterium]